MFEYINLWRKFSSLHWFRSWVVAAVARACLVLVSAGPSAGCVSSVMASEPGCVCGGSMIRETNFPDIFQGYESMIL